METKEIWALIDEALPIKKFKDENGNERKMHCYKARAYYRIQGVDYAGEKTFVFEVSEEDDWKWMIMEDGVYLLTLEERVNDGVPELICKNVETE